MRSRALIACLAIVLVFGLFLTGCGEPEETTQPTTTPTSQPTTTTTTEPSPVQRDLVIAVSKLPFTLDYVDKYGAGEVEIPVMQIYEGLVGRDKVGNPVPKLASSWEELDPTHWRFYLREGVTFHNGDKFTSRDVVNFVKWNVDFPSLSLDTIPLTEAVAIDDYTVDLVLSRYVPGFLWRLSYFYIYPTVISENRDMALNNAIGTGPYKLASFEKGSEMILEAYDNYWGPEPPILRVKLIERREVAVRLGTVLAGEASLCEGVSPEQAAQVADRADVKTVSFPAFQIWQMRLNVSIEDTEGNMPLFSDPRLRLALLYAIDKEAITTNLFAGYAESVKGNQPALPGWQGYNPDLEDYQIDLEKARDLVEEAGAVGKVVTLVGSADKGPKDREVCEALGAMIDQTGLKCEVRMLEAKDYTAYILTFGEFRSTNADILPFAADTEYPGVEVCFSKFYRSGGAISSFSDPIMDNLFDTAYAEIDPVKREQKLREISAYAQNAVPNVWICCPTWLWCISNNLEWNPAPDGKMLISEMSFLK